VLKKLEHNALSDKKYQPNSLNRPEQCWMLH